MTPNSLWFTSNSFLEQTDLPFFHWKHLPNETEHEWIQRFVRPNLSSCTQAFTEGWSWELSTSCTQSNGITSLPALTSGSRTVSDLFGGQIRWKTEGAGSNKRTLVFLCFIHLESIEEEQSIKKEIGSQQYQLRTKKEEDDIKNTPVKMEDIPVKMEDSKVIQASLFDSDEEMEIKKRKDRGNSMTASPIRTIVRKKSGQWKRQEKEKEKRSTPPIPDLSPDSLSELHPNFPVSKSISDTIFVSTPSSSSSSNPQSVPNPVPNPVSKPVSKPVSNSNPVLGTRQRKKR